MILLPQAYLIGFSTRSSSPAMRHDWFNSASFSMLRSQSHIAAKSPNTSAQVPATATDGSISAMLAQMPSAEKLCQAERPVLTFLISDAITCQVPCVKAWATVI